MLPPLPPGEPRKPNITSLMSPHDAVLDSVHHDNSAMNKSDDANGKWEIILVAAAAAHVTSKQTHPNV